MSEVLSVKEKIGYGMGDAASHIIFDNVMLYMMFFYTDIFGIPAGFVGTMFLLARALDAISDPCMGLIADRTRSRWGKFRPWILFGAIPFGIVCVLAYTTPDLSLNGKMVYAAVRLLLGGAVGTGTCYIDLLLFDKPAFMEKIIPFLKDYPQYRFYLSDFRQDCDLYRLFEAEDDESED